MWPPFSAARIEQVPRKQSILWLTWDAGAFHEAEDSRDHGHDVFQQLVYLATCSDASHVDVSESEGLLSQRQDSRFQVQ